MFYDNRKYVHIHIKFIQWTLFNRCSVSSPVTICFAYICKSTEPSETGLRKGDVYYGIWIFTLYKVFCLLLNGESVDTAPRLTLLRRRHMPSLWRKKVYRLQRQRCQCNCTPPLWETLYFSPCLLVIFTPTR